MRFLVLIALLAIVVPFIAAEPNKSDHADRNTADGGDFEYEVEIDNYHGQRENYKQRPCRRTCSSPRYIGSIHGNMEYFVFENCKRDVSIREARHACRHLGGRLADVPSPHVFHYLASRISTYAYINSWESNKYGNSCLALYPPTSLGEIGAIAVPVGGCRGARSFICEVPTGKCPFMKSGYYKSGDVGGASAPGCLSL